LTHLLQGTSLFVSVGEGGSMNHPCWRSTRNLVFALLAGSCLATGASSQSQSQAPPQGKTQAGGQSPTVSAEPGKSKRIRVYTNDDLSRLPNNSISVVGLETPTRAAPNAATELRQRPESDATVKSATGEEYWRGRARELQVKMSALDATIARVQENIANAAGHGYDIHTDILDLSLPDLLEQKADLQKQADSLDEEARKSGADPGWLR
jgi:hypothetical protein